MERQTIALLGVAAAMVLAGCATAGAPSAGAFEDESVLVQDASVGPQNETVSLVLTEDIQYSEETCWFNPATKTQQCNTDWYDTNIERIVITHNGTVTEEFAEEANYEGAEVTVAADAPGTYSVQLHLASGDTVTITFDKAADGTVSEYRAPR